MNIQLLNDTVERELWKYQGSSAKQCFTSEIFRVDRKPIVIGEWCDLGVFWNTALILNNCSNSTSTNQLKDNKQCANLHSHPSQEFVRLQYSQLSKSSLLQSASSSPWHKPNIIKSLRYTLFQNLSAISNYM